MPLKLVAILQYVFMMVKILQNLLKCQQFFFNFFEHISQLMIFKDCLQTFGHCKQTNFHGPFMRILTLNFMELMASSHDALHTVVLPRLVRMRIIKLMSFSGFVLSERAYYPRGRTI